MKVARMDYKYDILFKNAHIIDPASGRNGPGELLVRNSRVVPLPDGLEAKDVAQVIDCKGMYVLPGLINFHGHYAHYNNMSSLNPEIYELPNGVTTVCDAGSTGCSGFEGFLRTALLPSGLTMKAFINVASGGLACSDYIEDISPENYNERRLEYLFEMYGEHIAGLKLRIGKDINEGMGLEPLKASLALARKFNTGLSLHATFPLEPLQEIIPLLDKKDVLCHSFQSMGPYSILDEKGQILQEAWQAKERGVLFECAHGRLHCSFRLFSSALEQGFLPDIISTDGVAASVYRDRMFSLPVVMSRLMALGLPLKEAVRAVTATPAERLGLSGRVGTVAPGALADICIMKKEPRPVTFTDAYGAECCGQELLIPKLTLRAGKLVYCDSDFLF